MLTKLTIRNFKGLATAEIELGNPVVFVGPNDSGKTSALQALTLWDLGLRRWAEKRGSQAPPERPGVAVNRRDLVGVPVPSARQLWGGLRVRETYRDESGQRTRNIRIDVIVEGVTRGESWSCGLEFDYTNEEGFYCRPIRTDPDGAERMPVIPERLRPRVVMLGPMSGLISNETRLEPGAINVRLGEGRTAEVLRNICLQVLESPGGEERWEGISERLEKMFGAILDRPRLVPERGEVELTYRNQGGYRLDLTTAGRGMQQTLLLLSFISLHSDSVVLLDEPDAHMELLRQREIYGLLSEAAAGNGTQVICASHSEVVLNEALTSPDPDAVVAFVGAPHRVDQKSQVIKALRDIRFEDYYQAEITGFVLYLEGSTDLSMLRAFAEVLGHPAAPVLERPFVHYVEDKPNKARSHFFGLREAKPDLVGFALFDRIDTRLDTSGPLVEYKWSHREFENYLLPWKTLREYARSEGLKVAPGPLFEQIETSRWVDAMEHAITEHVPRVARRNTHDPFWVDTKISDDLLPRLFDTFFGEMDLPNRMRKANYHRLIRGLEASDVHDEVLSVLNTILAQAQRARPATQG